MLNFILLAFGGVAILVGGAVLFSLYGLIFGLAFRSEAAYAQLDITDLLKLRKAWPAVARVEIVPRTPGSRYWAFVSLTNNQTQLVTLVTPQ